MKICTRCGQKNEDNASKCINCNEDLSMQDKDQPHDVLKRSRHVSSNAYRLDEQLFSWGAFISGLIIPLIGYLFIASRGDLFKMIIFIDIVFCISLGISGKGFKAWSAFLGLLMFGVVILIIAFFQ